ncbi:hypothetical protein B0H10DRAFT_2131467 [Mycena sp. CBHHK59/15]|nr:hypothetical protein B0H10DRAFT_2131467 [Mycena sp. CBHHK59/15]
MASLLDRVVSYSLLTPDLIEELKLNMSLSLWPRWATEDVLNARAELIYFRRASLFLGEEPSFLFIPTSFINDCRKLMALQNPSYSPEIIRIRDRIRAGTVDMLGLVSWTTSHYSGLYKCSLD